MGAQKQNSTICQSLYHHSFDPMFRIALQLPQAYSNDCIVRTALNGLGTCAALLHLRYSCHCGRMDDVILWLVPRSCTLTSMQFTVQQIEAAELGKTNTIDVYQVYFSPVTHHGVRQVTGMLPNGLLRPQTMLVQTWTSVVWVHLVYYKEERLVSGPGSLACNSSTAFQTLWKPF